MKGSFIPDQDEPCYNEIKEQLSQAIEHVFSTQICNFLSLGCINGLRVNRGSNNFDTCYQYEILDECNDKMLNIKVYDKTLDLIGRDGMQMVGSKLSNILGCKGQCNAFIKRVCQAQHSGLTRLEMSICRSALQKFKPWQPSVKTLWHRKTQETLDMFVKDVLNKKTILKHVYKNLSLPHLLGLLGQCPVNLMMIGKENSWIINARTSHKQHFVGTRHVIGLSRKQFGAKFWQRLQALALRYASPGSVVKVFCLHPQDGHPRPVSEFQKKSFLPFQTPGCTKNGGNGIKLPPFIQNPIEKASLDSNGLIWWNEVQVDIAEALGVKFRREGHLEEDQEMKTEDIEVEETQLEQSSMDISHV